MTSASTKSAPSKAEPIDKIEEALGGADASFARHRSRGHHEHVVGEGRLRRARLGGDEEDAAAVVLHAAHHREHRAEPARPRAGDEEVAVRDGRRGHLARHPDAEPEVMEVHRESHLDNRIRIQSR